MLTNVWFEIIYRENYVSSGRERERERERERIKQDYKKLPKFPSPVSNVLRLVSDTPEKHSRMYYICIYTNIYVYTCS